MAYHYPFNGDPTNKVEDINKSGWYEMRDQSIYSINTTAYGAMSNALSAIARANDARDEADRDISVFIQDTEPIPLGNNDVWIDTGRHTPPNELSVSHFQNNNPSGVYDTTKRIWVNANTGAETSGLGKFYLQAYLESTSRSKAWAIVNELCQRASLRARTAAFV